MPCRWGAESRSERNPWSSRTGKSDANPPASAGRYVELTVKDSGVGMDADMLSHIFEPFYTTKDKERGTGLGLATVLGIVHQSGGHIAVRSQPGQGTTFQILFPAVEAEEPERDTADAEPRPTGGSETVLLVEDEPSVQELIENILVDSGYTVLTASNGEEALEIATTRRDQISLLLTDVVMPKMGGRKLVDRLKSENIDLKVIFMSGYTDDAIERHGVMETGTLLLQKPCEPNTLLAEVRDVLDRSSP